MVRISITSFFVAILGLTLSAAASPVSAADNLRLAPGISFNSDSGSVFPIVADHMEDVSIAAGQPTVVFFAATGDLNANRQAKRVVELYKKERDRSKFIVINVDRPANDAARALIKKYYPGYIPAELVIDGNGKVQWSQVGEVSRRELHSHIGSVM